MPRFYIDTSDGDSILIDEEGIELADYQAARYAALDSLPDMANDKLPDGDNREFVVRVRNGAGRTLYFATLVLRGGWCSEGADPGYEFFSKSTSRPSK